MIKPVAVTYLLGVGLLVLAGCAGPDQQESPTPTLARPPSPQTTPTLDSNPAATPTPSLIPTPTATEETPYFGLTPNQIVTLLPKDAIPALLDPKFTSVESVLGRMDDFEHVIGVYINGDARAYPIRMLSRHEIVNDVVGGEYIAVTW